MEQENKSEFIVVKIRKDLVPQTFANKEVFTIYNENTARVFGKNLESRARFLEAKSTVMNESLLSIGNHDEKAIEKMERFFEVMWELANR